LLHVGGADVADGLLGIRWREALISLSREGVVDARTRELCIQRLRLLQRLRRNLMGGDAPPAKAAGR